MTYDVEAVWSYVQFDTHAKAESSRVTYAIDVTGSKQGKPVVGRTYDLSLIRPVLFRCAASATLSTVPLSCSTAELPGTVPSLHRLLGNRFRATPGLCPTSSAASGGRKCSGSDKSSFLAPSYFYIFNLNLRYSKILGGCYIFAKSKFTLKSGNRGNLRSNN